MAPSVGNVFSGTPEYSMVSLGRSAESRAGARKGPALRPPDGFRRQRNRPIGQACCVAEYARRRMGMVAAVLALSTLVGGAPAAAASAHHAAAKAGPKLAQSGHAAFWDCPAKSTELLVGVNTLTLHAGSPLTVSFTVRNVGTAPCGYTAPYASIAPGPTSTALTAGPCGSVSFQVDDSHHHDVWPGNQVVNCPALGFAELASGATVSGTGSWNQDRPNSTRRVAPGTYRLVIDKTDFSFLLHVDGARS